MRVLAVEDDVDLLLLYQITLESDGHQVDGASDGWAAVEAAQAGDYDLVILDMMLPGLDGLGVLAELRRDERTRDLAVVIVSARIAVDDQVRGLESGAVAYLTKPFSIDRLQSLVTSIGAIDADGRRQMRAEAMARVGSNGTNL